MQSVSALIKKLIAYGQSRAHVATETDVKIASEACCRLVPRIQVLQAAYTRGAAGLQRASELLELLTSTLHSLLATLADAQEVQGGTLIVTSDLLAMQRSSSPKHDSSCPGLSAREQLEQSLETLNTSDMQADVLLADIMDDETYKLYEEIDLLEKDKDLQESRTIHAREQTAR